MPEAVRRTPVEHDERQAVIFDQARVACGSEKHLREGQSQSNPVQAKAHGSSSSAQ